MAESGKTYIVENHHIYTLHMDFLHYGMGEYIVWDVIRRLREGEHCPHANVPSADGHILVNCEGVAHLAAFRMVPYRIKKSVGPFTEVLV